jgi:hypothetical protein
MHPRPRSRQLGERLGRYVGEQPQTVLLQYRTGYLVCGMSSPERRDENAAVDGDHDPCEGSS